MAGRDFGADLFGTAEPSTAPATAGQDFGADLFGTPAPTTGKNFGADLFGTPSVASKLQTPSEAPAEEPGFFGRLKKSFMDVGIPQAQAGLQGLTVVAQGNQIAKTADRLKGLEAKGEGESKEAQGLRKTLDFYTKRQGTYFQDLAAKQKELQGAPTYSGVRKLSEAKTFSEGFKTFAQDPVNIVANLTAQSLPTAVPGLIAGVINPALGAAVLGGSSFGVEFGSSFLEFARDNGVDTSDPKQMAALFENKELLREGVNKAGTRAGIIGAGDLFLGGLASKTLVPKRITGPVAKNVTNIGAQVGAQSVGGGGFEAAAQVATEGKVSKPGEILAEAFGGLGTAPLDVYAMTRKAARDAKKEQPAETKAPIEPTFDNLDLKSEAPTAEARTAELIKQYRRQGLMKDDAEMLARRTIAEQDAEAAKAAETEVPAETTTTDTVEPSTTEPVTEEAVAEPAAPTLESITGELIDQGLPEDEARVLAQMRLDKQKPIVTEPTQAPSSIISREAPPTIESLTSEFVDQGIPEDEARVLARLAIERDTRETTERQADAVGAVAAPSGVSTDLAERDGGERTAGGPRVPESDRVVSAEQDAGRADAREGTQPTALTKTVEETEAERIKAEDEQNAAYEAKKAKAQSIAKSNANTAFDQVGEYADIDEALDSYRTNMVDTLAEEGLRDDPDYDSLLATAERAFEAEVNKQRGTTTDGTETTETVEAETQEQKAPAAGAVTPAKPKRGRPVTLTPEEKAATEAEKKEDRAARGRHKRAVDKAETSLQKALAPMDEGEFANEAELKEAQDDQRAERRNAVKELLRVSEDSGLKPEGKRARQILRDAKIPQTEIDDIKRGLERAKKALADKTNLLGPVSSTERKGAAVTAADPAFAAFKNGAQAIGHIIKTGTRFQKALAQRLRNFVRDVEFVVLEQDSEVPAQLQQAKYAPQWERSRALYIENFRTGKRVVYVRGASFGNSQGVNNVTVLHELLHAATVKKIALAQEYINKGINLTSPLVRAYQDLLDTMRAAQDRLVQMSDDGEMTDALADLYESTDGDIIADPREFLAYGMSDEQFQEFLMTAEGTQEDTSFFTRFVDAIRRMFGMDESDVNALSDLIIATDSLLTARIPPTKGILGTNVSAQNKKKSAKISAVERKLLRSKDAQEIADNIGILTTLRDPQLFVDTLGALWSTANTNKLRALLPALQTSVLVEWAQNLGISELARTKRLTDDMSAMRNKMLTASAAVVDEWLKIQPGIVGKLRGKKNELTALADVMHYSTDQKIDPTKSTKDPVLNKMWSALSPQAKKVYTEVRDFYQAQYDLYRGLLDTRIAEHSIPGEVDDPDTPKGRLMAEIKKAYETGKGLAPYFPLMRYGDFWLQVGSGTSKEFYMFESQVARDLFTKKRVRQLQAAGDTRSEAEMRKDQDLDSGSELSGLRKSSIENSTMLKNIFELLDVPGASKDTEALKDQIYQLYLTTMPESNFRRQFIHRKGTAGFSGDALRNFITSSVNMANQLSRIKYGYQMLNSIDAAQASLDGNPDKPRLEMLVKEMGKRVEMDVYPAVDNPFANNAANFLNKSAFLYFMTSVKTALVQFSSLAITGAPVLMSRHDPVQVAKEMGRFMLMFNQFGVVKDGKLVMPTIEASKEINLNADERAAIEAMHDRGIAEVTQTYDLMDRQDKPTTKYSGAFNTGTNLMGALFHHVERINREVMFMSSFRLTMNELEPKIKAKQMTRDEAVEQAIEQAVSDTHAGLGNFTAQERPRIMRAPTGRVLLQFKMFPMFISTYLIRNAYRATAGMDAATKKEARIQLIGTLTMSLLLAGYVGVPGANMAIGAISALLNAMRDEDEEDDPLEKRDPVFWFRSVYLPNLFGDVKIADQRLGEVIDAGMLDTLTGYAMSSSLSMNNMWFPELKEQRTAQATMMDYAMSLLGPSASLYLKQFPAAYDDFAAGRTMQGFEKMLPALFRNPAVAYRYSQEGARTATGAVIKEADEFTQGQLVAQALGFRTAGLAAVQEANFKAEALRQKVIQDKGKVRARLDRELELGSDEAVDKAMDKLLEFNAKNPQSAIKGSELSKQLLNRAKQRALSDRGFRVDKDMYPYLAELLDLSREKLEREAAKPEKAEQ
jgi:hypothetical protein